MRTTKAQRELLRTRFYDAIQVPTATLISLLDDADLAESLEKTLGERIKELEAEIERLRGAA